MGCAVVAGAAYFTLVFAAGFVGTLRILALVPTIGETPAVLLEVPVMLAICWFCAGCVLHRAALGPALWPRAVMGCVAFGLLMAAEVLLAHYAFGRSLSDHLGHFATLPGAVGLAGQVAFAAFPVLRR